MSLKNPMNLSVFPSFSPNAGELSGLMILAGINSSPKASTFLSQTGPCSYVETCLII